MTGMKDGSMADGDAITDDCGLILFYMDDTIILDIALLTNNYFRQISPDDSIKPDAGSFF